ncbi:MAG: DM13 domain-containing protein [Dehalococcoidia bacterium]
MQPDRLRLAERAALALSTLLGLAASIWAFASRELTDFLGEGPVRLLSLSDGAQQTTVAVGTLVATLAWTGFAAARLPLWRYALVAVAVLIAVALAPPLFLPMAALVALAALLGWLRALSPERREALAPARHPRTWAAGSVVAGLGLIAAAVVSVWLLRPLVDEGKTLDETLAFEIPGATATPAVTPTPALPAGGSATPASAATPAPTAPATPTASSGAAVLASGQLEGTDSFHFGSGDVFLVRGPEGELILRFEDYEVRNGPDLFIYLSPDPAGDPEAAGAINLGGIRATKGNVNYEVPAGTDVSAFRSAVIWCRSFDVVFAIATFQ